MANYPKKMTDPTEAALSAIQEALNLRDEDDTPARSDSMAGLLAADTGRPAGPAIPPSGRESFDSDAIGSRDLAGPAMRAANDDQQSIGQILQALQRRPVRSSYFVATIFSCAWIVGCLALSWFYLSDLHAVLGPDRSPVALMVGLGAAALLPIIFFFGVAHMASRAQELRLIAQSMAQVAMRLAEPESVARDSIVTVGQAIRREVAAMGDGVERALARASELEALVQNEVAALERTYSDNEVRIRGLLQDLASQRDTLVGQAEQVRSALNNVQIDLSQDLSTITDLVGQQVNEAAQRITHSLAERGEEITHTLGQIGDNMVQQLSERGGDLLDRLETASDETSRAIAAASDETSRAIAAASENLTANLNFKTNHIGEEFAEIATGLEDMMSSRLDRVTESFSEKSLAVVDLMIGRSQELTDAIIETSSQMAETIATRADEVNSTLRSSGDSLILDLDLRGSEVAAKLQEAGNSIAETLTARSAAMTDSVRESAEHVAGVVATRGDAVKEMLETRLAAFEEMFSHTGVELGEKIARDSSTLGNLITRHLAEFDRTVKTYGSELVERLGARTSDVTESMRSYVDNFDSRVTAKANEVTTGLDARLSRFQETLDSRSQSLTETLNARMAELGKTLSDGGGQVVSSLDKRIGDIAKTLTESSNHVVSSLDKRISDVTAAIDSRAARLADTVGERITKIDTTLGRGALEVANTLDTRIGHLEQLLVGRAEAVVDEMEVRSRAAADLLNARLESLSESIKTNSASAERALTQLATNTTEALSKSAAASTAAAESLNRSASEATVSLNRSAGALSNTITKTAAAADETLGKSIAAANEAIARSAAVANETVARSVTAANDTVGKAANSAAEVLAKSTQSSADTIGRSASEAERKLVGMSAEVSRTIIGKANEINTTMSQRIDDMTRLLDEKSNTLVTALASKGEHFAGEVGRITDQTVKTIDAKGSVFTRTMLDKSEEIARVINDASLNATVAVTRTLGQMQEGANGVTEAAKQTITRTLEDLHQATKTAIEQSKQTAAATVSEMMETHTMLRSDSTALFERLREANILLQEVLSGAQENMNSIEHTMAARVSEFVAAMSDLSSKSGATTTKVEQHLGTFNNVTAKVLHELGDLADQFTSHGRTLADAAELLDASNRRTDTSIASRQANIEALVAKLDERTDDVGQRLHSFSSLIEDSLELATTRGHANMQTLVSTLDARSEDFAQRLERFSSLLDESLDTATTRARDIAGIIADSSNDSVQTIEQQYELVRKTSEEERRRTGEALNALYDEASSEAQAMFNQSADRFTEIMRGMKQMAAEMQQELETTRTELRRGILELPQETAESAAQMRRVIVDQIEALAELNRIVARHGRSLDAVEPARREAEPLFAAGGGRGPARPMRADIAPPPAAAPQPSPRDITGAPTRRPNAPSLSPVPGGKDDANARNGGWLSDLLTRASREDSPPIAPAVSREPPRDERPQPREDRPQSRDSMDSIDTLSVDIARMIDHDAAADLWERYKRGERGAFTRRLYTLQGQKAFDEIRAKYRADPEFRQTVEHYIHEFERLLDDVSRGDRGPAVARNYLTSDTGKVYTMLAHAAGRFD